MFHCYHLYARQNNFYILHRGRRLLFQQHIVHQIDEVESGSISYLRRIQQELGEADYSTLCEQLGDAERVENETEAVRSGRLFVLISTHLSGDPYVPQNIHDAFTTSNRLGHPEDFLTMPCKQ